MKRNDYEHKHQKAFFNWVNMSLNSIPELEMCHSNPNGGLRHPVVAAKLKAEGLMAGVWDVSLDVPRQAYHGLRIEFKKPGNRLTVKQKVWGNNYDKYGYYTSVAYEWMQAVNVTMNYLELK